MGRSNCLRSVAYAAVRRIPASATPDATAHTATVARCTSQSSAARSVELEAAENSVFLDGDVGQLDVERRLVIERVLARHLHAVGVGLDEEQKHVALRRAGGDDHHGGEVRGGHDGLRAAQHPAPFPTIGPCRRRSKIDRITFGQRGGEYDLTCGHSREEMLTLDFGAELGDGQCGDERGVQRHRRDVPTEFLQQQASLEKAEAPTADIFG